MKCRVFSTIVLVILNLGLCCSLHITPLNSTENAGSNQRHDENNQHVGSDTNKAMGQTQMDRQQQIMSQRMHQNQMRLQNQQVLTPDQQTMPQNQQMLPQDQQMLMMPQNQQMMSQNQQVMPQNPTFRDQMMENSQPQQKYPEPKYQSSYIDNIRPIKYQIPMRPSYVDYKRPFGSQSEGYNSDYGQSYNNLHNTHTAYQSSDYRTPSGYELYPGYGQTYRYESEGRKQQQYTHNYESLKYYNTRHPSKEQHRYINSVPHPDSYKTPSYQKQTPSFPTNGNHYDQQKPSFPSNDNHYEQQKPSFPPQDYTNHLKYNNASYESLKYYSLDTCEYRFILDMVQCQESHDIKVTKTHTESHIQDGGPSGTPMWVDQTRGNRYTDEQTHAGFDIPNPNYHNSHQDNEPVFVPSFGHPFYAPGLDNQWFSRFYSSFRAGTVSTHEQTQSRIYYRYGDFTSATTDFQSMSLSAIQRMTSSVQVSSQTTIDNNWSGVSPLFNYRVYLLNNGCAAHGYPGAHPCIVFKGATHPYKEVSRVFIYVKQTTEVKVMAERERQTTDRRRGRK